MVNLSHVEPLHLAIPCLFLALQIRNRSSSSSSTYYYYYGKGTDATQCNAQVKDDEHWTGTGAYKRRMEDIHLGDLDEGEEALPFQSQTFCKSQETPFVATHTLNVWSEATYPFLLDSIQILTRPRPRHGWWMNGWTHHLFIIIIMSILLLLLLLNSNVNEFVLYTQMDFIRMR